MQPSKHYYKIGLLIFTNDKKAALAPAQIIEGMIKNHDFGILKDTLVLDRNEAKIRPILEDYKNTNLGMIIMLAKDAASFFPFTELEEIGERNEKFLVTMDLEKNLTENFQKIIDKVKASRGKPYRGCDNSCH